MNLELEEIYKISTRFLVPLTLEETFKVIIKEGAKIVQADNGSLFLHRNSKLERAYSSVPKKQQVELRERGSTYQIFKTGKPKITDIRLFRARHPEFKNDKACQIVGLPLKNRGKTIGVIVFQSNREEKFTKVDLEKLAIFCSMASLAIRKAELYSEIDSALKTRDLFISIAGHEIKTPLTAVKLYSELIYKSILAGKRPDPNWAPKMQEEIKRITNIIREMLEVERVSKGQLSYKKRWEKVSLIIDNTLATFRLNYPKRTFKFRNKIGSNEPKIFVDRDKLIQALTNLLNNAHKFSKSEKPIEVELTNDDKNVIIKIIDYGPGIPKKDLPHIFKGFYKGEKSKQGLGLGLFITKTIIDNLGGQISVDTRLHSGTTFTVRIPR